MFRNRVVQYLGKISYSIYLCHLLVIVGCQYCLLRWLPSLTQKQHVFVLGMLTMVGTTVVSHLLYLGVEAPGISLGKRVVKALRSGFPGGATV